MAWVFLIIAGLLEVAWAIGLKYSAGFTRPWPSLVTVVLMLGSFYCLSQAIKTIPLGTGYAIWVGIGAIGTATVGMAMFREPVTVVRLLCLLLIIVGVVGLKLSATPELKPPTENSQET